MAVLFWVYLVLKTGSWAKHFNAVVYWHSFHHSWFKNVNKLCGRKITKQNDFTLWNHSWLLSFCLTSGVELGREVEFAIAEMACVSSNVRRTFHVPSGVRVQRSISGRDVSHPRTVSCFCFRILIGCLGILGLLRRRMVVVSHLFRPQRS